MAKKNAKIEAKKKEEIAEKSKSKSKSKTTDWMYIALAFFGTLVLLAITINLDKIFPNSVMDETQFLDKIEYAVNTPEGDPSAAVVIEEFSDFQCPYCSMAQENLRRIQVEYSDEVYVDFKHFPLKSIHPNAETAAEASECARDQEKFWEMHDAMFDNPFGLDKYSLTETAVSIGLDEEKFTTCLDSGEKNKIVLADLDEGLNRGVRGTPTFFINGKMLVGALPYEEIKKEVEDAIQYGE